jgi:hypothetical protein
MLRLQLLSLLQTAHIPDSLTNQNAIFISYELNYVHETTCEGSTAVCVVTPAWEFYRGRSISYVPVTSEIKTISKNAETNKP